MGFQSLFSWITLYNIYNKPIHRGAMLFQSLFSWITLCNMRNL